MIWSPLTLQPSFSPQPLPSSPQQSALHVPTKWNCFLFSMSFVLYLSLPSLCTSCFLCKTLLLPLLPNVPFLWELSQHTAFIAPKYCPAFYGLLRRPLVLCVEGQCQSYSPFHSILSTYQEYSNDCIHLGTFLQIVPGSLPLYRHGKKIFSFLEFQTRGLLYIFFFSWSSGKSS